MCIRDSEKKVKFDINHKNREDKTLVYLAAELNRISILKYLVDQKKAKTDISDAYENTALHIAAAEGNYEICNLPSTVLT